MKVSAHVGRNQNDSQPIAIQAETYKVGGTTGRLEGDCTGGWDG